MYSEWSLGLLVLSNTLLGSLWSSWNSKDWPYTKVSVNFTDRGFWCEPVTYVRNML